MSRPAPTGTVSRRHGPARTRGPFRCDCGEAFDPHDSPACPRCRQRPPQLAVIDAVIELHSGARLLVTAQRDAGSWRAVAARPLTPLAPLAPDRIDPKENL